jgi:hypothetical protein
MEEISDEQQAAMALKLMDNVKQLIIDTVVENYNNGGPLRALVDASAISRITDTGQYSPMVRAVKEIVSKQMSF